MTAAGPIGPGRNPLKSGQAFRASPGDGTRARKTPVAIPSNRVKRSESPAPAGSTELATRVAIPSNRVKRSESSGRAGRAYPAPASQSPQIGSSVQRSPEALAEEALKDVAIPSNRVKRSELICRDGRSGWVIESQSPQIGSSVQSHKCGGTCPDPEQSQSPQIGSSVQRWIRRYLVSMDERCRNPLKSGQAFRGDWYEAVDHWAARSRNPLKSGQAFRDPAPVVGA